MLAAMAALGLVVATRESEPRRRRVRVPALLILVVLSMQSGCGGDDMTGPAPEQPTVAPGTYTFTVVARSDDRGGVGRSHPHRAVGEGRALRAATFVAVGTLP